MFGAGAGPEDKALRGRNLSAETRADTAGAEPSGSRRFPGGLPDGGNAKNPGGSGGSAPRLLCFPTFFIRIGSQTIAVFFARDEAEFDI